MKVVSVMAMSLNGKITRGELPDNSGWQSREDLEFFSTLLPKYDTRIMGRKTYLAQRDNLKHKQGLLRVILTKNPDMYQNEAIDNMLEFSSETPNELVDRMSLQQRNKILLLGGSEINGLFFNSNLVDQLYITIEPILFGMGKPFASILENETKLKLLDSKQLNSQGTMLLHYQCLHNNS